MNDELAERLARLEFTIAHLEHLTERLNEIVTEQARELAQLKRKFKARPTASKLSSWTASAPPTPNRPTTNDLGRGSQPLPRNGRNGQLPARPSPARRPASACILRWKCYPFTRAA